MLGKRVLSPHSHSSSSNTLIGGQLDFSSKKRRLGQEADQGKQKRQAPNKGTHHPFAQVRQGVALGFRFLFMYAYTVSATVGASLPFAFVSVAVFTALSFSYRLIYIQTAVYYLLVHVRSCLLAETWASDIYLLYVLLYNIKASCIWSMLHFVYGTIQL